MSYADRRLRSSVVQSCVVPRIRTQVGDWSFDVAGPRIWNHFGYFTDYCYTISVWLGIKAAAPVINRLIYLLIYGRYIKLLQFMEWIMINGWQKIC